MSTFVTFQGQLTSIMEVLTKSAVAEIIKLFDESSAVLRLEMSRKENENKVLKRKLGMMERELTNRAKQAGSHADHEAEEIVYGRTWDFGVWRGTDTVMEGEVLQSAFQPEAETCWRDEREESAVMREEIQQDPCVTRIMAAAPSVYGQDAGCEDQPHSTSVSRDTGMLDLYRHHTSGRQSGTASLALYDHHTAKTSAAAKLKTAEGSMSISNTVVSLPPTQSPEEQPEADTLVLVMVKEEVEIQSACVEDAGLQGLHTIPEQRGAGLCGVKREDWRLQPEELLNQKERICLVEEPSTEEEHESSSSQHTVKQVPVRPGKGETKSADCGNSASHVTNHFVHLENQTGKKLLCCTMCGKSFSNRNNLYRHQRIHTGEKPYSCLHCGKNFAHHNNFYDHVRIHTGERPYSCAICGKCFIQKSNFKRHQRVHTGERPFSCSHCGKSFTRLFYLKEHQQAHTRDKQDSFVKFGRLAFLNSS